MDCCMLSPSDQEPGKGVCSHTLLEPSAGGSGVPAVWMQEGGSTQSRRIKLGESSKIQPLQMAGPMTSFRGWVQREKHQHYASVTASCLLFLYDPTPTLPLLPRPHRPCHEFALKATATWREGINMWRFSETSSVPRVVQSDPFRGVSKATERWVNAITEKHQGSEGFQWVAWHNLIQQQSHAEP